jgi:hypothetical protein
MRAEETGPPGHKHALFEMHPLGPCLRGHPPPIPSYPILPAVSRVNSAGRRSPPHAVSLQFSQIESQLNRIALLNSCL